LWRGFVTVVWQRGQKIPQLAATIWYERMTRMLQEKVEKYPAQTPAEILSVYSK